MRYAINFLALNFNIHDIIIIFIIFYRPNFHLSEFCEKVKKHFLEFDNDSFILCGDF